MKIVEKRLDNLKLYKNNPRQNDEAVKYVANSIKAFGFRVPIVIDKNNTIICGHTRQKAAKSLGMETVPCVVADDLTPEQIKAFRLADNKVSEFSEWDVSGLGLELDGISLDMTSFGFLSSPEGGIIQPEKQELKPYKKVHYLITTDINNHDTIVDIIDKLKKMEGVEVESSLN